MTKKTFARSLSVLVAALLAIVIGLSANATTAHASEVLSWTNMGFNFYFFDNDNQTHQRPDFHVSLLARVERTNGEASLESDAKSLSTWQPAAELLAAFDYQLSDENAKLAEDYVVAANGEETIKTPDLIKDLPLWFKSDGVEYGIEYAYVLTSQVYADGTTIEFDRTLQEYGNFRYDSTDGCYTAWDLRTGRAKYYETSVYFLTVDDARNIDLNVAYNDAENAYGLRPESMEFALQRSCDNGQTWEYVTAHGAKFEGVFADATGTLNSNIVTFNVSNWAEIKDLPAFVPGDSAKACSYRLVEVLHNKIYSVSNDGAQLIDTSEDGSTQIVATAMTEEGSYCHCAFTNRFSSTAVTGYASFEGIGRGVTPVGADAFKQMVGLTLQSSVDGQTWTDVARADGGTIDPMVIACPMVNKFSFVFFNVPTYDAAGNAYTYRVIESSLEDQGFRTTCYTEGGAVTDAIYQNGLARNINLR